MIYLKSFSLPTFFEEEHNNDTPHAYPYGIFPFKEFKYMDFEPVTIFYGGNGSGKSTLLNLISEKLELSRSTPFNSSSLFSQYVETKCSYSLSEDDEGLTVGIPFGSKIITSEDVFNHILTVRNDNLRIDKLKVEREKDYY